MAKKKITKPETKQSTNKTGASNLIWKIVPALLIIAIVVYLILSNFLKKIPRTANTCLEKMEH